LFDLKNDPEELVNIVTDSKHANQLIVMKQKLKGLMKKYKDPVDIDKPISTYSDAGFNTDAWSLQYTEYH
jgi:hypothetical protein